ncbi:FecR family protein [Nitrobacter sp.]|uniref:FecR family protein n=1 Tax=Nitrobacter sp. TaxID=29420 RepID=UPI003F653F89
MSKRSEPQSPPTARDQALAWFVRLNSGDATTEERVAFRHWQAADPAHQAEFEKLAAMWGRLEAVEDPRRVSRRRALKTGGSAIGVAAILGAGYRAGVWDWLTGGITTEIGEIRTVTLPDSSQAELDADTALSVNFAERERRVQLQRGRALFKVSAADDRPFSVVARNGVTTALGTQFVVHCANDGVVVTVLEHAVTVRMDGGSGGTQATLGAGEQIAYDDRRLGSMKPAGQTEVAWRSGKLIFEDESLISVISDLNRYRAGRIVLFGDGLGALRVSGIFNVRNPGGVLDAIARTLPVTMTSITPYLVLIRPA